VIGFSDIHTRAHLYRAILEGLAYALREGADRMSQRSGIPITELHVAGGGSQSNAAMQLTADVFGLLASRPHVYEASGLGAAIDAAVGSKIHPDFPTAINCMTHRGESFEPNMQTHGRYDELFNNVYKQMYSRLKPLYRAMLKISTNPGSFFPRLCRSLNVSGTPCFEDFSFTCLGETLRCADIKTNQLPA